jgi:hypothetical protein
MKNFKIKDLLISIDSKSGGGADKNACVPVTFVHPCVDHSIVYCPHACSFEITRIPIACANFCTQDGTRGLLVNIGEGLTEMASTQLQELMEAVGDLHAKIEEQIKSTGSEDLDVLQSKLEEALKEVKARRESK